MKNKLLLTSALAGAVSLSASAIAEVKLGGNVEFVFNSSSDINAMGSTQGNGIEENISFNASKDIDLGTLSYGFNLENGATEGGNITLKTSSGTTFQAGSDAFQNLSATVVPNTGEAYQTIAGNITGLAYAVGFDMDDALNKNAFGYAIGQDVMGGMLSFRYTNAVSNGNDNAAGDAGDTGGSSYTIMYRGSLGVEGLSVLAGYNNLDKSEANTESGSGKTLGIAYNTGNVTVGAQKKKYENPATAATQDEWDVTELGVAMAVNDQLSVSLNHITTDGDTNGVDFNEKETIIGLGIGYNLGGLAIELSYADVSDAGGVEGADGEAIQLRTVQRF